MLLNEHKCVILFLTARVCVLLCADDCSIHYIFHREKGRKSMKKSKIVLIAVAAVVAVSAVTIALVIGSQCDHQFDNGKITTAATCTEKGVKTFTCTDCGETKTEEIEMLAHAFDEGKVTTEATCTKKRSKDFYLLRLW